MNKKIETLSQRFCREAGDFIAAWFKAKGMDPGSDPLLSDEPYSADDFTNAKVAYVDTDGVEVK